jgi:hypothetical protein
VRLVGERARSKKCGIRNVAGRVNHRTHGSGLHKRGAKNHRQHTTLPKFGGNAHCPDGSRDDLGLRCSCLHEQGTWQKTCARRTAFKICVLWRILLLKALIQNIAKHTHCSCLTGCSINNLELQLPYSGYM